MEAHDTCTQRAVTIRRNQAILSLEYQERRVRSKERLVELDRFDFFRMHASKGGVKNGERWTGEGGGGKRSTPVTPRSYDASLIPEMLAHTL